MHGDFLRPELWKRVFNSVPADKADKAARLETTFIVFRERSASLLKKIETSLPHLTIHDISHIDALWETSDLIVGPDYPLNPLEVFILGGAMLLHDAALCFEAYESGQEGIRNTVQWQDAFAAEVERNKEREKPSDKSALKAAADFTTLRLLHADQAPYLVERSWYYPQTVQPFFLIDDTELRNRFGRIIGQIAASHGWNIEDLESKLPSQINAPGDWPAEWRIDAVKIACILRCADAAHIDNRRAPDFLYALVRREGISFQHWKAQNWLARADLDQSDPSNTTLLFTSTHDFLPEDSDAWWIAYDAIRLVQKEIIQSNSLLKSRPQHLRSPEFLIRQVEGTSSPEAMSKFLRTHGWKPRHAEIHVGNIERLVKNFGGQNLYGSNDEQEQFAIVTRELIQNARDAISARRKLDDQYEGLIRIRLIDDGESPVILEIIDDGIGMAERVLTGPLLDFGSSFWKSDLLSEEFPGLRSSGFNSIGRYGVGFYSIFMVATSVRVASRRWDRGLDTVASIDFPKGLTLRPIFSINAGGAFSGSASTVVTCTLKGGEKFHPRTRIYKLSPTQELQVPFIDFIGRLVAALDVAVDVSINGENWTRVNDPIQRVVEDETAKLNWLQRISLSEHTPSPDIDLVEIAKRLRPIYADGCLVGLAALRFDQANPHTNYNGGIATIGGFLTGGYGGLGGQRTFFGYMEQASQSAKRDAGAKLASNATMREWANHQLDLIKERLLTHPERFALTHNLCDLEIDPSDYALTVFFKRQQATIFSIDQIFEAMKLEAIVFFKFNMMFHVDTYVQQLSFGDFLTFRATDNSSFLSLELENEIPKNLNSFIGCLYRRAARDGYVLKFEVQPKVVSSFTGSADVFIVSLHK